MLTWWIGPADHPRRAPLAGHDHPARKPGRHPPARGTLMRHFSFAELFTATVTSLTPRVTNAPRPRRLIATSRCPQRRSTSGARARRPAVDLPPVTPGANPHLPAAPSTQEKPEILSQPHSALPRGWTRQRFPAILGADAACAASVVRRPRTWQLTTTSPGPSLSSAALPDS